MTGTALAGSVLVPLFGVLMCVTPMMTRPTVQFGVRVPPAYATAAVIRRERRGYRWRSALVAICATAALIAIDARTSGWPSRIVLNAEVVADFGCYWWARRRITKVKTAEGWFAGQRQTVVADTTWRTEPQAFPVGWLLPAIAVIAATVVIGVLRYPHLPAYLIDSGGRRVVTSPARAFAMVVGQLCVTGIWTALLVLVYRSRPDLDTADPAASLRGYRRALGAFARAALILLACVDLSLLLSALRLWQVASLPGGTVLIVLPAMLGLAGLLVTAVAAGRARARVVGSASSTDRDDDRFWKAGLVYVNRGDPAVLVSARFGFGWTANFGNPAAWLLIAGIIAVPAGLVIIALATSL